MMNGSRLGAIGAALALLAISPLFVILMVANRLLFGRTLFRQVRVGRGLRPFVLFKFQTMVNGAEAASTVTVRGDPRVTRYGRVLRLLKMDELPQLLNMVRGEMTLVGPRPLTPNEIEAIPRPLAEAVYRTLPGLTGISALAFVDEEEVLAAASDPECAYYEDVLPRKIALELAYVQRRTWWRDLAVVVGTPLAALSPGVRRALLVWLVPEWEALERPRGGSRRSVPGRQQPAGGSR
ncbi:MAG: sugar transferase [Armatimonadota bacterium]|nr:sugar transferase [Armatimonadota bacterium]MDR7549009.1 sugar transferase [Armatimonadota bacterium]